MGHGFRYFTRSAITICLIAASSTAQTAKHASHVTPHSRPNANAENATATAHSPAVTKPALLRSNRQQENLDASGPVHQLTSLFDIGEDDFFHPVTTIRVGAAENEISVTEPAQIEASAADIVLTAGTFGDISRYLQTLPGVISTGDSSNQLLVRGGHPIENLFLVDGIVIPNLNHLGTTGSTGGLAPMLDAAAIQGLEFHTSTPAAQFPERLSSVTEIRTLEIPDGKSPAEADLGIEGLGGLATQRMTHGDLLVSAHHGLMNLFTKDIGLNGVPSYTNTLARYQQRYGAQNRLELLTLAGWDSLSVVPCASDVDESSSIQSSYSGRRQTSGLSWQRVFNPHSFGLLHISDTEQVEQINQEDQIANPLAVSNVHRACPIPANIVPVVPVYHESSNGSVSSTAYDYNWIDDKISISAGSSFWLQRPHYDVQQPSGTYTPYSSDQTRSDAVSFRSRFSVGETGSYAQATITPTHSLGISAGVRIQSFAFGSHTTATPRAVVRYRLGEEVAIHAGYARYAQLPPYILLLAFPQNGALTPMRAEHIAVGADFIHTPAAALHLEAYQKTYTSVPASTEYSSVTFESQIDMLGNPIVWLPMTSSGVGRSSGIELSGDMRLSRLSLHGTVAYARARFAGLDHIYHAGSFDLPWVANLSAAWSMSNTLTVSSRVSYATGRPYTPYDVPNSLQQNRPIYDLNLINAHRAPFYCRVDLQVSRQIKLGNTRMYFYGGLDNALNRPNFLSYAWLARQNGTNRVGTITQMPIFPNFGIRTIFR